MTAYLVSRESTSTWSGGATPPNPGVAVRAGSFEVRIGRIEISRRDVWDSRDAIIPKITRYASGTISGGSALPIEPLRQGAPAATATARGGEPVTVSGTGTQLTGLAGTTSGTVTYEFPFDCTLSPGAVLLVDFGFYLIGDPSTVINLITVSFEELRLSWSY